MSDNLQIYENVRAVPPGALRQIKGGRLNGKTDINPMWRIKTLTEMFGPCGIGWKVVINRRWLETAPNGEISAFVEIDLCIKHEGVWSEAIPGTGGSSFVANEKSGPYVSDECYKMALTDAISVSCKMLGVAADIYWEHDNTKYNKPPAPPAVKCPVCGSAVKPIRKGEETITPEAAIEKMGMCVTCYRAKKAEADG